MTFSEKMKYLRDEKGKTQQQASDEMGIAISSLRNYESGRLPDTVQLKIIKDYYNVTYEYLLDDECENKTNLNVEIGKELGLSDKSINKIKNINILKYTFENNRDDSIIIESNIKMLNSIIENFDGLQHFLYDLYILDGNLEIYKETKNISFINFLFVYLIDCYYNDKKKLNEMLTYIDTKIEKIIELLHIGQLFSYIPDEINCLREYKNNLIMRLNQKKMTTNSKYEIQTDLEQIVEICLEMGGELNKEIIFNQYKLSSNINTFINNYKQITLFETLKETNGVYLSNDEELNKFILEGKKKQDNYTKEEINKYTILNIV